MKILASISLLTLTFAVSAQARSTRQRLDTTAFAAFADSIARGNFGHVDGIRLVQNGVTRYARDFPRQYDGVYPMTGAPGPFNYHDARWHPYHDGSRRHTLQSVTKSVTSLLFGIAASRGDIHNLDAPVATFLPAYASAFADPRKQRITIRHLMSMTSSIRWPEGGVYDVEEDLTGRMEKSVDWPAVVLSQPMEGEAGSRWNYSSGGAALLAAIFKNATGVDLQDYAREHLWGPLGVTDVFWKRSPGGLTDSEGGLYVTIDDLAKLGQMLVDGGSWNGRSIVPAKWIAESTRPISSVAPTGGDGTRYGLLWWVPAASLVRDSAAFYGHGYGGQYLVVMPATKTVAVITQWNLDTQHIPPAAFVRRVERAVRGVR
jgi:CubicO group peptidase (beta-lactamase class C family)